MGRLLKEEVVTPWLWYLGFALLMVTAFGPDVGIPVDEHWKKLFMAAMVAFYLSTVRWSRRERDHTGDASDTPGDPSEEPGAPAPPPQ